MGVFIFFVGGLADGAKSSSSAGEQGMKDALDFLV